jgi:glutathione S-transferase
LNFKKLPYETVWVEYPDIEKICKEIGAEATRTHSDGRPLYTLPAILDPNTNTAVSDSYRIAEYLEKTYPDSPKLFPKGSEGMQAAFYELFTKTVHAGFPRLVLNAVRDVLNPTSQAHFRASVEELFGDKMEEFNEGAEEQWEGFKAAFSKVAVWYDKNGGNFIQGDGLTYADMNVAAFFAWHGILTNREPKKWKEMSTWDNGKWVRLVEALKPYETVA